MEYNGVVLSVRKAQRWQRWAHQSGRGACRSNWEIHFHTGGVENTGVRRRLLENKQLIYGLEKDSAVPKRVISQCHMDIFSGTWSFWTEDLTETELLRLELQEIARGEQGD